MTAPLYLAEMGSYRHLSMFNNIDIDYRSKRTNENILFIIFRKMYEARNDPTHRSVGPYLYIFKNLIDKKFDLNFPIDNDGNTPLMYFIMIYDKCTLYYLFRKYRKLDVNLKNKYGEDAIILCIKLDHFDILKFILKKYSYKYDFHDKWNNNLLMYWSLKNHISLIDKTLRRNISLIDEVNCNNETALIVATKLGNRKAVSALLFKKQDVNHQDNLGNTALYYAVDIENDVIVNRLLYYNADPHIKNKNGQSPYELATELGNEVILELFENPVAPKTYESKNIQEQLSSIKDKTLSIVKKDNSSKIITDMEDPNFDVTKIINFKSKYQTVIAYSMSNIEGQQYEPFPNYEKYKKFLFHEIYSYSTGDEKIKRFVGDMTPKYVRGIKGLGTGFKIVSFASRFL